jgi:lysophospholipase L1-like esterase
MKKFNRFCFSSALLLASVFATAALAQNGMDWHATWTASQQGAFAAPASPATVIPDGDFQVEVFFPQPDTMRYALPGGAAADQSFRMVVRPDIWSNTIRIRLSNVFGKEPLAIGSASAGLQEYSANVIAGTNVKVTFNGQSNVSIPVGERVFSDPIQLPFVIDANKLLLRGSKLAVSFSVQGSASALSYHNIAQSTSYIGKPGSGDHASEDSGDAFIYTTSSWFILDAVDVMVPEDTDVVVAFGDSITDGTYSTINGNDRWPDVLAYRLHQLYGDKVSVVIQAMSGNRVVSGGDGEPAIQRLDRDVLGTSGVTTVILMEGVNDIGSGRSKAEPVIEGYKQIAARLKQAGITIVAATLTPNLRPDQDFATSPLGTVYGPMYGSPETQAYGKQLNEFIRTSGIFDAVVDFEAATLDPKTGVMHEEFVPNSNGGPGDYLHPNRLGLQAMGNAIDPAVLKLDR